MIANAKNQFNLLLYFEVTKRVSFLLAALILNLFENESLSTRFLFSGWLWCSCSSCMFLKQWVKIYSAFWNSNEGSFLLKKESHCNH